ncbi:MAG TPA: hypothetical protein VNM92_05425, partial [Thermoanaerobaculia bacterium]|nr:hypothetical protein [Thermoanaerobaculia bacterium]
AWMRGARRFCDEGIVDTMSRSEIAVQRSRQAAIRRLAAKVCEKCGLATFVEAETLPSGVITFFVILSECEGSQNA